MSFQRYGDPSTGQVATRPQCWGQHYNSESRECRGCGFSASCREHIVQLNINRQNQPAVQATPQVAPAFPLAQYSTPAPVPAPAWPPAPAPQAMAFRPPAPPTPPVTPTVTPVGNQYHQYQQAQRLPPHIPAPAAGGYGSTPDHMFNYIGAIPAPIRPQYEGETFAQRVFKNAALGGVEGIVGQVLLGIRQYRWYPTPAAPPEPPTIPVSPVRKD